MNPKKLGVMIGGIIVGNWIAERFVLSAGPDDPTGFIPVSEGIGMDEVVRAALGVFSIGVLDRALRRF